MEGLSLFLKYGFIIGMYIFIGKLLQALYLDIKGASEGEKSRRAERRPVAGRLILLTDGMEGKGWAIPSSRGALIMGRDEGCDVILRDEYVSKHHARLLVENGRPWIEDLGSTNGTYLNGRKVSRRSLLRDGDIIKIGGVTLRFRE